MLSYTLYEYYDITLVSVMRRPPIRRKSNQRVVSVFPHQNAPLGNLTQHKERIRLSKLP